MTRRLSHTFIDICRGKICKTFLMALWLYEIIGLSQLDITIAKMYHLMPTKICLWDYAQSSIMHCLSAEWSTSHRDIMVGILSIIDQKQLVNPITSLLTENKPGPLSNVHHVGCTYILPSMYVYMYSGFIVTCTLSAMYV